MFHVYKAQEAASCHVSHKSRNFDMFQPQSESIYYDIVKLNKKGRNNYLNNFFTDKKSLFSIKVYNIYYFLIGYL